MIQLALAHFLRPFPTCFQSHAQAFLSDSSLLNLPDYNPLAGIPTYDWTEPQTLACLRAQVSPTRFTLILSTIRSKSDLVVAGCAAWAVNQISQSMTNAAVDAVLELNDPLLLAVLGSSSTGKPVSTSSQRDSLNRGAALRIDSLVKGECYFRMARDSATAIGATDTARRLGRVYKSVSKGLLFVQYCLKRVDVVWGLKRQVAVDAIAEARAVLKTFEREVIVVY